MSSDARGYVNARDNASTYARVKADLAAGRSLKPDNDLRRCDAMVINRNGTMGQCKRRAKVEHDVRDARGSVAYCRQHDDGAGVSRMLRPYAWETTATREL